MSVNWIDIWHKSRENWHWPQLPLPRLERSRTSGEFQFQNYAITLDHNLLIEGNLYLENFFDHLIVHYLFCPRSLEMASNLALATMKKLQNPRQARTLINIFSDIVVDSFRLERSHEDEEKVLLGWGKLALSSDSPLDKIILGFLSKFWEAPLLYCSRPEVDLLYQVFSLGVRNKSLWPRQCQQMALILDKFTPNLLGKGPIRSLEMLNGNANSAPIGLAADLEPDDYQMALDVLGLKGDLKRWYRDQSYFIEIKGSSKLRSSTYPSGPVKWRLTDPWSELDTAYTLSMSQKMVPGVTTYKREQETSRMAVSSNRAPDLLVVLDSSRSMDGHHVGSKTHRATLAAFKACQFAHSRGAQIAVINFSEKYLVSPWTRDLNFVEDILVEFQCARTHIPGKIVQEMTALRKGCLILCITDTHIQNMYEEWDFLRKASENGNFVLFCLDKAYKDRYVEESLATLGPVYYIDNLEDLVSLVVEVTGRIYAGESFISLK